jgi:hypothetical protein
MKDVSLAPGFLHRATYSNVLGHLLIGLIVGHDAMNM